MHSENLLILNKHQTSTHVNKTHTHDIEYLVRKCF